MELKPGYKQTEVGVIPEDWEVSTFGDVFDVTAGGDVDPKRSKSYRDDTHCYPIYSNALTNHGLYGYCSYGDHQADSITITARGSLGFANFRDHTYTAIGRVLVLHPKQEVAGSFFAEVINNCITFAIESTGVPQLTAPQISTYRLPVPPLPEQRAIAGMLADVDALLGVLTQLIAKKRDLKQAAMQQLLTGQTRLPGFSGEWEVTRLGEIGSWLSGGTPSMSDDGYWNGDIPWVSPKDMKVARLHDALDHVSDNALGSGARLAPRGAVLMVVRGMILAHSFPVARAERPLAFNQDIKALVVRAGIESDFVLHWLRANETLLLSVANEATHGTKRIPSEALFATEFVFPPRREQTAIAAVLSDMDAELAALEQRLAKTRALKQGMMQELLTGRTRLV